MNSIENLSPEERRKLLAQLIREKKKTVASEETRCIHELFEAQAEKTPQNVAVISESTRLTYGELNARANQVAHYLNSLNVGPENRVGLYLGRSVDRLVGLLGILKSGGTYVPFEPAYPDSYLFPLMADAGISTILTHSSLRDDFPSDSLRMLCLDQEWPHIASHSSQNPANSIKAESLAYLCYASGQGVLVDHAGLAQRLSGFNASFPLTESDVASHIMSLMQDAALVEIFAPLLSGATVVLGAGQNEFCTPDILGTPLSVMFCTPSDLRAFLDRLDEGAAQQFTSLRLVFCSGEPLFQATVEAFFQYFHCDLYYLYSLPEASGEVMFSRCRSGFEREIVPLAQSQIGKTAYVLDKLMQPVPPGVQGEVYIGGRHLAQGYLHDVAECSQQFVTSPFSETGRDRLFKTGEIGCWLYDGTLDLIGMVQRSLWHKGRRVNLAEIEAALSASPLVADCRVLARKTRDSGSLLVAYVVLAGGGSWSHIHTEIQSVLPDYMLPDAYVPVNILPLTEDGQVDEQALSELAVFESKLLEEWEQQLQALPEIVQAAMLVTQKAEKIPHWHLADLLPDWKRNITHEDRHAASEEEMYHHQHKPKSVPAFSSGGELQIAPDAPDTLGKALQRLQSCEHNIIYIQPDNSEHVQSYAELLEEAGRILNGLRKQGLQPQDKVILQLSRNEDILPAFWGCILGGIIPVITAIPPSYSESNRALEQFCHVWNLLDHPLIIFDPELEHSIQSLSKWIPVESSGLALIDALRDNELDTEYHPAQPDDVAFFPLTSGSTGVPKCIMLTHRNLLTRARGTNQLCGHSADDVILNWLPFDHIGSISDWHVRCIDLGCQAIYAQKEYILARPLNWLDLIDRYRITHSWAPNFAYSLVNDTLDSEPGAHWDLSCLESLLTAGEAVSSDTVEVFKERLARFGFKKTAVRPAFGMAEMASGITYFQPTADLPSKYHRVDRKSLGGQLVYVGEEHPHSITFTDLGPAIPSISLRIVDEKSEILPEETLGRVQVKGDPISKGYYKNPEATQEVYLADGWFDTGDIGFLSEGHLVLTGRAKESIVVNGVNYYCNEIESVVEAVEGIDVSYSAACAVHDPDATTEKLALFFSTAIAEDAPLLELLKQIQSQMTRQLGLKPDYLLPVSKETIPKTAIGKIQRLQLGKRFEAGEFDDLQTRLDLLWENTNTLPDWFFQKTWQRKEAELLLSLSDKGVTLIFSDELGLGTFLGQQLTEKGQQCIMIEAGETYDVSGNHYRIDPKNPEHYGRMLNALAEDSIVRILHLWPYTEYMDISTTAELERAQEKGIFSLLYLVQALAKRRESEKPSRSLETLKVSLYLFTSYAQAVMPTDQIAYEKATLPGFIKTITQEMPWLRCCLMDLPAASPDVYGKRLLREIRAIPVDQEIAFRDEHRLIPRLEHADFQPFDKLSPLQQKSQDFPLKSGGVYLMSGGLGGIGLEISKYMLEQYRVKLLLIGISPQKDRAAEISMLEQHGDILYHAADVCNTEQIRQAVEQAHARWGKKLDGVIHLAGVLQERELLDETTESVAAALRPKVQGTFVLHQQLLHDNPEGVFIMFSSVNGFFGGSTVAAYSAANSFLDGFSAYQNAHTSLKSYCLSWSLWDETGMSRNYQMKEFSRQQGYYAIKPVQGFWSFLTALRQQPGQMLIGLDAAKPHIRSYVQADLVHEEMLTLFFTLTSGTFEVKALQELMLRDRFETRCLYETIQLDAMPLTESGELDRKQLLALVGVSGRTTTGKPAAPRNDLEQALVELWQEIFGVEEIGIYDNFFELGGNSLTAIQILSRVQDTFDIELPLHRLFEVQTIEDLAIIVEEKLLEEIEKLSEEEAGGLMISD